MASKRRCEQEDTENVEPYLEPTTKQFKPEEDQAASHQEADDLFNAFLESHKMKPSDFKNEAFERFIKHLNEDSVIPTIVKDAVRSEDDPTKKYNDLQELKDQQPKKDFIYHCLLADMNRTIRKTVTDRSYLGIPNIKVEPPTLEEMEAEANPVKAPVDPYFMRNIVLDIMKKQAAAEKLLPKEVVFKQKADKYFRLFINTSLLKASAFDNKEFQDYIQHLNSNAELPAVTKNAIKDENDPEKRFNDLVQWKAEQDKKDKEIELLRTETYNHAMYVIFERRHWSAVYRKARDAKKAEAEAAAEVEAAEAEAAEAEAAEAAHQNDSEIAEAE